MTVSAKIPGIAAIAFLAISAMNVAAQDGQSGRFGRTDVFDLEYATEPRISPDGERIIYVRRFNDIMADKTRSALWIIDVDSGDHRPLLDKGAYASSPRWSPSGDRVAYIAEHDGRPQIHVRWLDTGQTVVATDVAKAPSSIAWSPDGRRIAFTMAVAEKPATLAKPPEKPDGADWAEPVKTIDRVVYRFDGRGFLEPSHEHIFVVPAEGGTPRQITSGDFDHGGPLSWAPDGRKIYFAANRNADWEYNRIERDIFAVSVADRSVTNLTDREGLEAAPVLSPDGTLIAFEGAEIRDLAYRTTRIHVMAPDGSDERVLTAELDRSVENLQWAGDGEGLYFTYDDRGMRKLGYVGLDGTMRDVVSGLGGTTISRPYISGTYTVADNGVVAFTDGAPDRPADIAVAAGGEARTLTALNEDLLGHKELGEVHEITYESDLDGQEIQGWYITPPDFDPDRKYPLILEIHGGPHAAYGPNFAVELQRYAAEGYVVFYDNHRGSSSYGEEFALLLQYKYSSEADFTDHMSGVDAMIDRGFIDADNLFVTGGSAGGIATAYAVGLTDRFNAAAAAKPVINWISKTLTGDIYTYQINHQFPGMPWEAFEHYWKRSPLSLVGQVTTPTLLMTGEEDYRTPISETEQFYQALKLRRVDTMMVRVPGASHGIAARPSHLIAKSDNILAWFERYRTDGTDKDE